MANRGERGSKFDDGDRFQNIMSVKHTKKSDRWYPPKSILREMKATEGDHVVWIKKEDNTGYRISVLSPKLKKYFRISEDQADFLLREIIKKLPKDKPIKGDHIMPISHLTQVKSHGRLGSKNQLTQIFNEIDATDEDFFVLDFFKVDGDEYFPDGGWDLSIVKGKDIPSGKKRDVEVKDNGMASSI